MKQQPLPHVEGVACVGTFPLQIVCVSGFFSGSARAGAGAGVGSGLQGVLGASLTGAPLSGWLQLYLEQAQSRESQGQATLGPRL